MIRMNEEALARLRAEKRLEIIPGAGHLFEEPGVLEEVARLAAEWFAHHLVPAGRLTSSDVRGFSAQTYSSTSMSGRRCQ